MNNRWARTLSVVPALVMLVNAVGLVIVPARILTGLGLPLLDGVARSTELGDLTAFFTCAGGFALYGASRNRPVWTFASAWLLGLAAIGRIIASMLHGAELAVGLIAAECVLCAWLVLCAVLMKRSPSP